MSTVFRQLILRILLSLGLLALIITGFSQPVSYKMNFYSVPEGVSSGELYDVIQDDRGFIWLSMNNKLNRFDGYTFKEYITPDKNLTSASYLINDFSVLEKLGTTYFIIRYLEGDGILDLFNTEDQSLKAFDLKQEFAGSKFVGFTTIRNSENLAVLCEENKELLLYQFDLIHKTKLKKGAFSLSAYPFTDNLENIQISTSSSGFVCFSAAALPVICFDLNTNSATALPVPKLKKGYHLLKTINEHEIYLVNSTDNKVLKYDLSDKSIASIPIPTLKGKIEYLWFDQDGNIIVGNSTGRYFDELILLPKNTNTAISLDFIVKVENKISQIRGDHFLQQILVSTFNGFYIFSNEKKRFKTILNQKLERTQWGNILRAMQEDGQGNLYIAEEGNNLYKMKLSNDSIIKIYQNSKVKLPVVGCIKITDKKLWGISYKSRSQRELYNFDLATEKFKYWPLPISTYKVKDFVLIDTTKFLFFGYDDHQNVLSNWVFNFHTEKWTPFVLEPYLEKLKIQIILKNSTDSIWLGAIDGLYLVSLKNRRIEKIAFGPPGNPNVELEINALAIQPVTNYLLIGNEDGIWIYNPTTRKYVNHFDKKTNYLSNNLIEGILPVNENELFITTQYGLNFLNLKTGRVNTFYEKDGLAQNEFNRFSIHRGSNSKYYFGGTNGLSIVEARDLNENTDSKKVAISRFYKYDYKSGSEVSVTSNLGSVNLITIEPDDQYFGFDLMYPDYTEPRLNQFQTWLEGNGSGFEMTWQNASLQHQIQYGRLPKGNYTLHFRAFPDINNEISIPIKVKVHFYQSPWFIPGLSFAVLAASLSLFFIYKNNERNKELEKQKTEQKFKDLEAAALRAQMNPHFIFNCLGSIQHFITEHDTASASKYLSNFARLVRLALHSSVDGRHSLQDEIDMLDNYLGLERLRFGDKFTYSIQVDPNVEKDEIYFPPLLIQPFVENALVHGMKNKTEGGRITVAFSQDKNVINVSVTDNGPGFSVGKRSLDSSGHRSVGMTLTKNRLEILSSNESFSMVSIVSEDGSNIGTQVNIVIPVL
jgi:anti-sigma regulatory factor (Ser/Thr protein kinase)